MWKKGKEIKIRTVGAVILLFLASFIRVCPKPNFILDHIASQVVLFIYVILISLWGVAVFMRIINLKIRRYLMISVFLMLFFVIVRTIRYKLPEGILNDVSRYAWYSYYIPMILIPLLSFGASFYLRKYEKYKINRKYYLLFIVALVLIVGIFTNDYHQLAFKFEKVADGKILDNDLYERGIFYYIVAIWMVVMQGFSIINILSKCKTEENKKERFTPIGILLIGIVYSILYNINTPVFGFIEITAMMCAIYIGIWESCIQIGMVPSNLHYKKLFATSSIATKILDKEGNVVYASSNILRLDKSQFEELKKRKMIIVDGKMQYSLMEIRAGYAIWQNDISKIMKTYQELLEIEHQLKAEYQLLQEEISVKKQAEHIREKNRLYNLFTTQISRQLNEIQLILKNFDRYSDSEKINLLKKINVIGVYIKRKCNLVLIMEDKKFIPLKELKYCLDESIENLKVFGANGIAIVNQKKFIKTDYVIMCYDLFEILIEFFMTDINTIMVSVNKTEEGTLFNVQLEIKNKIKDEFFYFKRQDLDEKFKDLSIEVEKNDLTASILIRKEEGWYESF